ncbi:MAG: TolC family protein [Candidatus Odyssella sp.]|nr:TolC family protein [Candidatus Odyssella sp.]
MIARIAGVIALPFALAACQTFSQDGGMGAVQQFANAELQKEAPALRTEAEAKAARAKVEELLGRPLNADGAVQVALLNNRGLQAAFNDLFFAEALAVEASLPPNPTFSIARLVSRPEIEIERQIAINLLALATLPARSEIAREKFRAAQLRAAEAVARIAADTRRAYYRAVATQQSVNLLTQAQSAALTATQLARRLGETGALNKLDQAREQVFYAELTGQLATARQRARTERERLVRLLGLWGGDVDFRLPGTLPALPQQARALPLVEQEALRRRVDLQMARIELLALAKSLGLSRATRFLSLLEINGRYDSIRERDHGERFSRSGFEIEFTIPIWDFGEARTRQAEQTYLAALNRLADKAVSIRSEAREAYRSYRATHEIARHYYGEVLPLRKVISDETLLRYNAMQIDVFELLSETRQRIAAHVAAIEALREFWLAEADLGAAIVGGGSPSSGAAERTGAPAENGSKGH